MEFALMTEPQVGQTYDELVEAARWCEANDVKVFARSDHYLSSRPEPNATDAFATLAGLARETSTVDLCVLVSPISFRHPAVILKTATTIAEMSGDRLRLGVGTGWMELEHEAFGLELWPMSERFDRFEEALGYLRSGLSGEGEGFSGRYYSLEAIPVRPTPRRLPIIVGGGGPKRTPRLAGQFADEFNMFITTPDVIADRVHKMRAAAEAAGRDPDLIEVSVMGPVLVGGDEAAYRERLTARAADRDRTPGELEARYDQVGIPVGPPERARETLAALEAAGVQRYYLQQVGAVDYAELGEALTVLR